MSADNLIAIEGLLMVLAVFGWGFWELHKLKRDRLKDEAEERQSHSSSSDHRSNKGSDEEPST